MPLANSSSFPEENKKALCFNSKITISILHLTAQAISFNTFYPVTDYLRTLLWYRSLSVKYTSKQTMDPLIMKDPEYHLTCKQRWNRNETEEGSPTSSPAKQLLI